MRQVITRNIPPWGVRPAPLRRENMRRRLSTSFLFFNLNGEHGGGVELGLWAPASAGAARIMERVSRESANIVYPASSCAKTREDSRIVPSAPDSIECRDITISSFCVPTILHGTFFVPTGRSSLDKRPASERRIFTLEKSKNVAHERGLHVGQGLVCSSLVGGRVCSRGFKSRKHGSHVASSTRDRLRGLARCVRAPASSFRLAICINVGSQF